MTDTKISLTIEVPGAKMVSKEESLKSTQVPVVDSLGKVIRKKDGKPLTKLAEVDIPEKNDFYLLKGKVSNGSYSIKFGVRKQELIKQVINLSNDAYDYFVETPTKKFTLAAWKRMGKEERVKAHLESIASHLGGKVSNYYIFED